MGFYPFTFLFSNPHLFLNLYPECYKKERRKNITDNPVSIENEENESVFPLVAVDHVISVNR
jgi:hypothetical protein